MTDTAHKADCSPCEPNSPFSVPGATEAAAGALSSAETLTGRGEQASSGWAAMQAGRHAETKRRKKKTNHRFKKIFRRFIFALRCFVCRAKKIARTQYCRVQTKQMGKDFVQDIRITNIKHTLELWTQ